MYHVFFYYSLVVVTVTFSSLNNVFEENELGAMVGVQIDKTILRNLDVSIFGGANNPCQS